MDQKQNTIIESIGVYLPPHSFSTDEILKGCKHKIHFALENITGIKSRRMAGEEEFSIDLARKAVASCLAKSQYKSTEIDLLICCNISRYDEANYLSFEPSTSLKLKKDFGFNAAISFDISNACAGMFTGIYIANAFLQSGAIRRAMIVSGEYITHLTRAAQREISSFMDPRLACLTLGDAGAALILENTSEPNRGFTALDIRTFGAYSEYCVARASEHGDMMMYTDSINLTDVAVKSGATNAMDVLQRAGWTAESFQHLIMHQTSTMTMNSARRAINRLFASNVCHDGNTLNNLEHRGNTASTSHFVAIDDHIRNNNINSGDKIAFSISASGLTTGTALYVFDDLPDRLRNKEAFPLKHGKANEVNGVKSISVKCSTRIRIESVATTLDQPISKPHSLELLKAAATGCLSQSVLQPNDIEILIYCGVYRTDYVLEPAYASLLAGVLEMNSTSSTPGYKRTLAFDIFNGALGFLNACSVAQQIIAANHCVNVMVVAAEVENNKESFDAVQIGVREIASAIILQTDESDKIGFARFLFSYELEYLNAYTAYYSTRNSTASLQVEKHRNLETLYLSAIVTAVHELLQLEGLDMSKIHRLFPPQISSAFIDRLSESLDFPREKCIDVVGNGSDLFTSSLPCGLQYAYEKEQVKEGDIGLMISVGSGIQVGCAIYHF